MERLDHPPSEVVVVRRPEDTQAAVVLDEARTIGKLQGLKEVLVEGEGQIAALIAGVCQATADIVAFLDDDTEPRSDWLGWIVLSYSRDDVWAVGGRDVINGREQPENGEVEAVGLFNRYGGPIGNHHLGGGIAREVEFLKGCNASYRRAAFGVMLDLRGRGAQVANDMSTGLWVRLNGGSIMFEPRAKVDHYPAGRADDDGRLSRSTSALSNALYNRALVIFSLRRERRLLYFIFLSFLGHAECGSIWRRRFDKHLSAVPSDPPIPRRLRVIWQAAFASAAGVRIWTPDGLRIVRALGRFEALDNSPSSIPSRSQ